MAQPPSQRADERLARWNRIRRSLEDRLFAPVDIAPLVFFRVFFGAMMLWEVTRYLNNGWIERYYVQPEFFFTYLGFGWLEPLSGNLMYVHFLGLGILAVMIALGLWYRVSTSLFFLGFTYVFLLDQTNYLNHFYLIALVSFLLVIVPAHRAGSLDAVMRPRLKAARVPEWSLFVLRVQLAIVYVYGGIAKLNADWLQGEPMRTWLAPLAGDPLLGFLVDQSWSAYAFSYGGLALDLLIIPLLLWRPTRVPAFVAAALFHLLNAYMWSIGIFPWFMIGATMLFFDPARFRPFRLWMDQLLHVVPTEAVHVPKRRGAIATFVAAYLVLQMTIPLRHFLYPGNVSWTEEGHNFSWHMKLRDKAGNLWILAQDVASGRTWTIDQNDYLTPRQRSKMVGNPDMILLFARYLKEELFEDGYEDVSIHAFGRVSLNGRPGEFFIDPELDLATTERSLWHKDWILPLEPSTSETAATP